MVNAIMATSYQKLESEKYWNDVEAERVIDERRARDKNAFDAFTTFLIGLLIVGVFNMAFHYWLK